MPLNESASFLVSLVLAVLTFSSMQVLRPHLAASQPMTIAGGFLGSLLFVFLLTCLGNLEKTVFGKGFATKWVEVVLCLTASTAAAATVHRVSATTSVLFAGVMLYYMHRMSAEAYGGAGSGSGAAGQVGGSSAKEGKKKK